MKELIETMERRARERAEAILADGRDEAERIREEAEREVERRREDNRERVERAAASEAARGLALARHAAAAVELEARREALDRVFDRARALLDEPAGREAWSPHAPGWLERALAYAPAEATVVCDPSTAARIAGAVPAGTKVEARDDAAPGLVVRGGSVEIDATLRGLLERRRERLAIVVIGHLEGGDEGE